MDELERFDNLMANEAADRESTDEWLRARRVVDDMRLRKAAEARETQRKSKADKLKREKAEFADKVKMTFYTESLENQLSHYNMRKRDRDREKYTKMVELDREARDDARHERIELHKRMMKKDLEKHERNRHNVVQRRQKCLSYWGEVERANVEDAGSRVAQRDAADHAKKKDIADRKAARHAAAVQRQTEERAREAAALKWKNVVLQKRVEANANRLEERRITRHAEREAHKQSQQMTVKRLTDERLRAQNERYIAKKEAAKNRRERGVAIAEGKAASTKKRADRKMKIVGDEKEARAVFITALHELRTRYLLDRRKLLNRAAYDRHFDPELLSNLEVDYEWNCAVLKKRLHEQQAKAQGISAS